MGMITNDLITTLETLTDPQRRQRTLHKDCLMQLKRGQNVAEDREFPGTEEGKTINGHALFQDRQGNFREKPEQAGRA